MLDAETVSLREPAKRSEILLFVDATICFTGGWVRLALALMWG
jgi:hypothetical protein